MRPSPDGPILHVTYDSAAASGVARALKIGSRVIKQAPGKVDAAGARQAIVLEYRFGSGLLQSRDLQDGGLVAGRDTGIAVFHARHFALDI
jgi:hypothetical protein